MRCALILLWAVILNAASLQRAWGAEACAWIVESVDDEGTHKFDLNLSVDAPASVSVRFQGPNFTSGSMGGDLIQLNPGEPQVVDNEGFDVSAGDDLHFDVKLFSSPLATLEEMENPPWKPLAAFTFDRKVGEDEHAPPPILAVKQCEPLG